MNPSHPILIIFYDWKRVNKKACPGNGENSMKGRGKCEEVMASGVMHRKCKKKGSHSRARDEQKAYLQIQMFTG